MHPANRKKLADRVNKAATAALAAKGYVSAIDVLTGMGWLEPATVQLWRKGQLDYLERQVHANLSRISEAMKLFRSWANARGLRPSETVYARKVPGRPALRFSKSGHPSIERQYRTHFVSKKLAKKKSGRPAEETNFPPEAMSVEPDWLSEVESELAVENAESLQAWEMVLPMLDSVPRAEVPMRTTIAIDDELLAQAQAYTGLQEKSALVHEALKALIEREAARRLARLGGTGPDFKAPLRPRPAGA
jgi:Arc/MetJ family transcription regulator